MFADGAPNRVYRLQSRAQLYVGPEISFPLKPFHCGRLDKLLLMILCGGVRLTQVDPGQEPNTGRLRVVAAMRQYAAWWLLTMMHGRTVCSVLYIPFKD